MAKTGWMVLVLVLCVGACNQSTDELVMATPTATPMGTSTATTAAIPTITLTATPTAVVCRDRQDILEWGSLCDDLPTPVATPVPVVTPEPVATVHPAVAAQVAERLEAAVEFYELVWPWVREAWDSTAVLLYADSVIGGCPGALACVTIRGSERLLNWPLPTAASDDWERVFIHELAHVWDVGREGRWADLRQQWRDHYVGCSHGPHHGDVLAGELLADAMAEIVGADITVDQYGMRGIEWGSFYRQGVGVLDGCLVQLQWPFELEAAIAAELVNCGADIDSLRLSMLQTSGEFSYGESLRRLDSWQSIQRDHCG